MKTPILTITFFLILTPFASSVPKTVTSLLKKQNRLLSGLISAVESLQPFNAASLKVQTDVRAEFVKVTRTHENLVEIVNKWKRTMSAVDEFATRTDKSIVGRGVVPTVLRGDMHVDLHGAYLRCQAALPTVQRCSVRAQSKFVVESASVRKFLDYITLDRD